VSVETPASAAVTTSGARSEEMTMSSYAESVVETYRRATPQDDELHPHGGDNGDHENCDRRLDR